MGNLLNRMADDHRILFSICIWFIHGVTNGGNDLIVSCSRDMCFSIGKGLFHVKGFLVPGLQ